MQMFSRARIQESFSCLFGFFFPKFPGDPTVVALAIGHCRAILEPHEKLWVSSWVNPNRPGDPGWLGGWGRVTT